MDILVACEESQRVCIAFRKKGHNAFSCDIIDCSGGHPEWHIKQKEARTQGIWKAHFKGKAYAWNDKETSRLRSQTPYGVAEAMAEQWG